MKRPVQRGFSIVAAIFILVVLAALGGFIVSVSTSQQIGSAQDLLGTRAYQAARAGIEWGLHKLLRSSSCTGSAGSPNSFTLPSSAPTLAGFTVSVYCTTHADPGGHGGPTVYEITATACNQPDGGKCPNTSSPNSLYIERRLKVTI